MSAIFTVFGVIVFIVLYIANIDGDVVRMLLSPIFVIILLISFLPAAILAMISARNEKKYCELRDSDQKKD